MSWPGGLSRVTLSRWAANKQFETLASITSQQAAAPGLGVLPSKSFCRITEGITANSFHMGNSLAIEPDVVASRSPTKRSEARSRSSTPRWRSHDAGSSTTALAGSLPPAADELLSSWTAVRYCFDLPAAQGFHSFAFKATFGNMPTEI
ncbi:hypothetical protein NKH37_32500 [Mesorhizobium sp. M1217]|uniref:hypothetical protein n=1 Tax=Mesorhizobium sp. M1217 TaxID=2957070 RepID=UPI00333D7702